jgi:hypothetical protein
MALKELVPSEQVLFLMPSGCPNPETAPGDTRFHGKATSRPEEGQPRRTSCEQQGTKAEASTRQDLRFVLPMTGEAVPEPLFH